MRGSREISLVPSLHRASTDALIPAARAQNTRVKFSFAHLPLRATKTPKVSLPCKSTFPATINLLN